MAKPANDFDLVRDIDSVLPMEVQEQRVSGLVQSLLVAVCLRESLTTCAPCLPPASSPPPCTPFLACSMHLQTRGDTGSYVE